MKRTDFSSSILPEIKDLFDTLWDNHGGHKYRILEGSIEAFNALPKKFQDVLRSNRQEDRKLILDLISALKEPPSPGGRDRQEKNPKSK